MNVDHVYGLLAELRKLLPALEEALIPGTPRRWTQRDVTDAERDRIDAEAIKERAAREQNARRGLSALGESAAPLRVGVLDAAVVVHRSIAGMERAVCEWLTLTPLAGATPAERITRLVGLLDRIAALDELAAWFSKEAPRLVRTARQAIGDITQVRQLDARCPICDARSLRAIPERELVVCVNTYCACSDDTCRCHRDPPKRHLWRYKEWPWLAQILADDLRSAS